MAAPPPGARLASVNVGEARTVEWMGRSVTTAIWKSPVDGEVAVAGVNLAGDEQADRRVHGGADKAVYAYALEDYRWWSDLLGVEVGAGTFGENLTTSGIDLNRCSVGDRWLVGTTLLEVAQPRTPCFKLAMRMGDASFPARFDAANRPGAYLRIVCPGTVRRGDMIVVEPTREPAVRIGEFATAADDDDLLRRLADDPRIPAGWRRAAARALRVSS
jgi:MOSC domain-containing protein YiiM